jgi:hypothetical protein
MVAGDCLYLVEWATSYDGGISWETNVESYEDQSQVNKFVKQLIEMFKNNRLQIKVVKKEIEYTYERGGSQYVLKGI